MSVARKVYALLIALGVVASGVAFWLHRAANHDSAETRHLVRRPSGVVGIEDAPVELREFLDRVMDRVPENPTTVSGYRFTHWRHKGKPTQEGLGLKAINGADPNEVMARVMDVDGYVGNIAHVMKSRAIDDAGFVPPGKVRFYQSVRVPGIAKVQQELVLVDAGTIKGYRVVGWYLLKPETEALKPKDGARSEFNVGAWIAAPGVLGYALSTWPRRGDVNALQWMSLTSGADALARDVVEGNIDGLAEWADRHKQFQLAGRR